MTKKKIFFIDTNFLYIANCEDSVNHFFGGNNILNYLSDNGQIIIPKIIIEELYQQKKEIFEREINKIKNSFIYKRNTVMQKEIKKYDIEKEILNLKKKSKKINYRVADITRKAQALDELRSYAVSKKPPFKGIPNTVEKGKNKSQDNDAGFKDGLFYMTVKEWIDKNCSKQEFDVYVLTNDDTLIKALKDNLGMNSNFIVKKDKNNQTEKHTISIINQYFTNNDGKIVDMEGM